MPHCIRGGPKIMQRFWSVISTTFLIEYHWFLLYWIEYSYPSNLTPSFDYRASILRQYHFQNVPLFPRKQAWSSWNLFQNQLYWQKHNCPHFEKEDNMNESEAFITQHCGTKFQLLQACWTNGIRFFHYFNTNCSISIHSEPHKKVFSPELTSAITIV